MAGAVALAGALMAAGAGPVRAAADATVSVDHGRFDPFEAAVDEGGRVTWIVAEGGHTIAADDGRFRFRGDGGAPLAAGTTVSFTFATGRSEYVNYHCEIHGGAGLQGMAGRVRVGGPPAPPPYEAPVLRVPEDRPTLASAVAAAKPGLRIVLAPGDHPVAEPVEVAVSGVTIAGADENTRLVPAPGTRGFPDSALRITGGHVSVEQVRVGAFRSAGVVVDGADSATLTDVAVDGEGFTQDGILARGVTGLALRRTVTTGNRNAGVVVSGCAACGVRADGVRSQGNGVGVLVEAARGVRLEGATITGNGAGVVGRTARHDAPLRAVVIAVEDSVVSGGIALSGPADSSVTGNWVDSIVVAGDWAEHTVVARNVVEGRLAWDGLGLDVAFTDNVGGAGQPKPPTIGPAALVG